jgi:hypothetical protein
MNADDPAEDGHVFETELLRRYIEGGEEECAEVFLTIYGRFRCTVREEMERQGLGIVEAEQRVGAVFGRTLAALRRTGAHDGEPTLRECLLDAARHMATNPEWRPSR